MPRKIARRRAKRRKTQAELAGEGLFGDLFKSIAPKVIGALKPILAKEGKKLAAKAGKRLGSAAAAKFKKRKRRGRGLKLAGQGKPTAAQKRALMKALGSYQQKKKGRRRRGPPPGIYLL